MSSVTTQSHPSHPPSPEQIRFASRNFLGLQGLCMVPAAIWMAFLGLRALVAQPLPFHEPMFLNGMFSSSFSAPWQIIGLILLPIGALAIFPIQAWYKKRFGGVKPLQNEARKNARKVVIFGIIFIIAMVCDIREITPLSLSAITFIAIWTYRATTSHYTRSLNYAFLIGSILAVILPQFLGSAELHTLVATGFLVSGIQFLMAGIVDHRILTRMLPPIANHE